MAYEVDDHIGTLQDTLLERRICQEQVKPLRDVQAAINAIRAIHQLFPVDVAAICAVLSSKVAADMNAHLELHQVAVEELDKLHDHILETTA